LATFDGPNPLKKGEGRAQEYGFMPEPARRPPPSSGNINRSVSINDTVVSVAPAIVRYLGVVIPKQHDSPSRHDERIETAEGLLPAGERDPLIDLERGVRPTRQHSYLHKYERDRLPVLMQLVQNALAFTGRRELPDAQVRHEARREPAQVVAVRDGGLQSFVEAPYLIDWVRGKPERASLRAVVEEVEFRQCQREWLDGGAGNGQGCQDGWEIGPGPEGVQQVDVGHPAEELAVVKAADHLDRLPDVLGWNDGNSSVVRLGRHACLLPVPDRRK
jgi:hypothetical protein